MGKKPPKENEPPSNDLFFRIAFAVSIKAPKGYQVSFRGESLGVYPTIKECLEKYNTKKIDYIRELVNGYGNKMPDEVREILLGWKPEEYRTESVA